MPDATLHGTPLIRKTDALHSKKRSHAVRKGLTGFDAVPMLEKMQSHLHHRHHHHANRVEAGMHYLRQQT